MEEDWRGFWEILTYNGNSSTPIPFILIHSTSSQTSPQRVLIMSCRWDADATSWMIIKNSSVPFLPDTPRHRHDRRVNALLLERAVIASDSQPPHQWSIIPTTVYGNWTCRAAKMLCQTCLQKVQYMGKCSSVSSFWSQSGQFARSCMSAIQIRPLTASQAYIWWVSSRVLIIRRNKSQNRGYRSYRPVPVAVSIGSYRSN
jgi:hypothetical protein